jgi:hypothetical protein
MVGIAVARKKGDEEGSCVEGAGEESHQMGGGSEWADEVNREYGRIAIREREGDLWEGH